MERPSADSQSSRPSFSRTRTLFSDDCSLYVPTKSLGRVLLAAGLCTRRRATSGKVSKRKKRPKPRRRWQGCLRCAEGLLFNGPSFDEVVADMIAESRSLRDLDCTLRRDGDFRFDDVFHPIARAGGNVARHRITRQSRDSDVVGATDAALEHAATP